MVDQFLHLFARRLGCAFLPKERESLKGLPLEYFVYFHLHQYLASRGGVAAMGGHLEPLGGDGALDSQLTEVDGVAFHQGTLWFVECKPTDKDLRERAPLMAELVRSVGGREARGSWWPAPGRGALRPREPNLVYMALEGGEGLQGVYRFPQALEGVLFTEFRRPGKG